MQNVVFETWAVVGMGLGALGLWGLATMFTMAILIAGSRADDNMMGDKQYEQS